MEDKYIGGSGSRHNNYPKPTFGIVTFFDVCFDVL